MAEGELDLPPPILDRERMLAAIAADPRFDAIVVGGGITGAGTVRDLALQGLRVLLVERGDFAGGASGALTRIAHGGFRYLERGEIALVRDSVVERDRLVANAPHALRPIRVVLPLASRFGGLLTAPLRFLGWLGKGPMPGILPMAIGRRLYDALAGAAPALPPGAVVTGAAFEREFPFLKRRYRGALCLGEARILMPERVAVELVEDAVAAAPRSAALNYCALVGRQGDRLEIEDRVAGRRLGVTAGIVVNAAGAHADKVAALLGLETAMTGGVAGVHLVLDAPALAATLGDDLLFFEDDNADPVRRRLLVCYRLGGDRVLLGTTETPLDDPDAASVTAADEAYLAGALAAALPGTDTRGTIVGRLVGVRPLMRSAEANVSSRSRDHAVLVDEAHGLTMVTIIGGKWTTFRRMAEDAADAVLAKLERRRSVSTRDLPIGGGRDYPATSSERQARIEALVGPRIDRDLAARLFDIYGTRAGRVAAHVAAFGAGPVRAGSALTAGEVAFFRAAELATSDEDCFRRRSDAALLG